VGEEMDSDHLPVTLTLNLQGKHKQTESQTRKNFLKTDWEGFQINLDTKLDQIFQGNFNPSNPTEIENSTNKFTEAVQQTIQQTVPDFRQSDSLKLPESILNLIKTRRKLRKLYQRTRNDEFRVLANKQAKQIRQAINELKQQISEDRCHRIVANCKDPAKFWHDTKIILGTNKKQTN
jgi:hypothetical protein